MLNQRFHDMEYFLLRKQEVPQITNIICEIVQIKSEIKLKFRYLINMMPICENV
jgi:hypothetical protein